MILVTGATGNVGRHVVAELARAGQKVRALTRDPATARLPDWAGLAGAADGIEIAATADPRLDDVTAIFLNLAVARGTGGELLARAREQGVRRVVLLSSSAAFDDDPGNPLAASHLDLEREVEAAGFEWTHLRPGAFAANALQWGDQLREGDVVRGPYAGAHTAPIDERDIAAVAAKALTTDDLVGTRPELSGPEALTQARQVEVLGDALGRPARYEEISHEAAREAMTGGYMTPAFAETLLRLWAEAVDQPPAVSPMVEQITGRPPRTFAEWAKDNVHLFA